MGRITDSPNVGFHPVVVPGFPLAWRVFAGQGGDRMRPAVHLSTGNVSTSQLLDVLLASQVSEQAARSVLFGLPGGGELVAGCEARGWALALPLREQATVYPLP